MTPGLTRPLDGLSCARAAIQTGFAEGLKPPPPIDFTQWAIDNIRFGKESEFEGPYNPDLFPFFREVLETLQPDHPARTVVLMKSAQLGGTVVAQVYLGASLDLDPGPFLYVHPTIDNGKRWVRTKWKPFVRLSKGLRAIFPTDARSRDGANTLLYKERSDERGHVLISGANSASSLSMVSYPRQVQDDLAKWENNEAGDPEGQADSRSEGFEYAKIFKVSTPMIKGACRIAKNFEHSDQRKFYVPCPHCEHEHTLDWDNFKESLHEGMDTARACFTCPDCGGVIEHHHKRDMVAKGRWIAAKPESKVPGFYIWSAYSPLTTWARIADKWLKAMGDPEAEQTFFNDALGLPYEQKGEAPPWSEIRDRAAMSGHDPGIIPPNALILTAGVDCQGDRLEVHVKGFGEDLQRFTILYTVIEGDISEERSQAALDALLKRKFRNAFGREIQIDMMAIDGNYDTETVLDWAKRWPENKVIVVRGSNREHAPPMVPVKTERTRSGRVKKYQKRFWNIGVSGLKAALYKHLEKIDPMQRGFCGYPRELDEDFFVQLCSERRVTKYKRGGYTELIWEKLPGVRNEVLDTEIYAEAAARRKGWMDMSGKQWDELRRERETPPDEQQFDLLEPNLAKTMKGKPATKKKAAAKKKAEDKAKKKAASKITSGLA